MAKPFRRKPGGCYTYDYRSATGRREWRVGTTSLAETKRLQEQAIERERRVRLGLVDPREERIIHGMRQPIAEHVTAFCRHLSAKGNCLKYLRQTESDLRAACQCAKWATLRDVNSASALRWLDGFTDSTRSRNRRRGAIVQFCRWAEREGLMAHNPLAGLPRVREDGPGRVRRRITPDELTRIIDAARAGPRRCGMSGPDRAAAYIIALATGFRAAEIASLTRRSFSTGNEPTITVRAAYSKNRKEAVQPIARADAERIAAWLSTKHAGDGPVLHGPAMSDAAKMLRADMADARAAWIAEAKGAERKRREASAFLAPTDENGHVADFHAIRAAMVSGLVESGANVRVCQQLARHSTPALTIGVYTKLRPGATREAIETAAASRALA